MEAAIIESFEITKSDIVKQLEELYKHKRISKKEKEKWGKRIKTCGAWDCNNAFVARKDLRQKYCSSRCKQSQDTARKRHKKTGSYFPHQKQDKGYIFHERFNPKERVGSFPAISLDFENDNGQVLIELFDTKGRFRGNLRSLQKWIRQREILNHEIKFLEKKNKEMPVKIYYLHKI